MSMSQAELIDDYLTNHLDEGAKVAFEEKMKSDPQLKTEVELQKQIIEGVKNTRIAELKAMLNNVPVGGTYQTFIGKAALATVSAGLIGTVLYFALSNEPSDKTIPQEEKIEQPITQEIPQEIAEVPAESEQPSDAGTPVPIEKKSSSDVRKMPKTKPASPKIDVMDLSEETPENNVDANEAPKPNTAPTVKASTVEVATDNTNASYSFHYQFKDSKLVLYGPFDSSLYEIIEINGGTHTLFLYYKNSYYHLDESEHNIVPLIMIRDLELLDKLKKYRSAR